MMWSPPQFLTGTALVVWMGVGVIGFYTAMTIFTVPHASLGAELSMSYDDRNRVFGWRHVSFMSGAFVAIGQEFAGAPQAGLDFIQNQHHFVLLANTLGFFEIALVWHDHTGLPLNGLHQKSYGVGRYGRCQGTRVVKRYDSETRRKRSKAFA